MSVRRVSLAFAIVCAIAAIAAPVGAIASGPEAGASARKCPKGKKLVVVKKHGKVVRKNGKPVKKCVKKQATGGGGGGGGGGGSCRPAVASCALPPPLFDPPGKKLEGNDAIPFLEKYLANSTFTDCVKGWPECVGGQENRYSHGPGSNFHKCILRPTSGSDIIVNDEYELLGALVEPDGSWAIREKVYDYGHLPEYLWRVSTSGVVTGEYAYPGNPIEGIGPLQYLSGSKDCSY